MVSRNVLKIRQNYPLWMKVEMTKRRISEFYDEHQGEVYVSFSGGKDSTVLLHLARSVYKDIEGVFSDTGLEYPELKQHVKNFENITIIRPTVSFKQFIETNGYPIISKNVCNAVRYAKKNLKEGKDTLRLRQLQGKTKGSIYDKAKWEFLLYAPFELSEECCKVMKKDPIKEYELKTKKKAIVGTLAIESKDRTKSYLQTGCFDNKNNKLIPLGFWTEQDILKYIVDYKLEIPSVYGDIVEIEGKLKTTGESRSGCIFCGMGAHLEVGENRFQRLKRTHPQLHEYCMDQLGMKEVLDYINVESE